MTKVLTPQLNKQKEEIEKAFKELEEIENQIYEDYHANKKKVTELCQCVRNAEKDTSEYQSACALLRVELDEYKELWKTNKRRQEAAVKACQDLKKMPYWVVQQNPNASKKKNGKP